jgi:hypothetical protein
VPFGYLGERPRDLVLPFASDSFWVKPLSVFIAAAVETGLFGWVMTAFCDNNFSIFQDALGARFSSARDSLGGFGTLLRRSIWKQFARSFSLTRHERKCLRVSVSVENVPICPTAGARHWLKTDRRTLSVRASRPVCRVKFIVENGFLAARSACAHSGKPLFPTLPEAGRCRKSAEYPGLKSELRRLETGSPPGSRRQKRGDAGEVGTN